MNISVEHLNILANFKAKFSGFNIYPSITIDYSKNELINLNQEDIPPNLSETKDKNSFK